jgi:hypothetical protein
MPSHYDVPIPVIGWTVGLYMKSQYEVAFRQMLKDASTIFDRASAPPSGG